MRQIVRFFVFAVAALGLAAVLPASGWAQGKKHDMLQFTTGSPTGTWFPTGAIIAELTNAKYDGQPISVVPGAGGVGNPARVGTGHSDLGISYGPFLKLAQQGKNEMYEKAGWPELRAIASMTPNKFHLILDSSMGVAGLSQLKTDKPKLRVATGPVGSTELFSMTEVLKEYGVSFEDIESWGGRVDRLGSSGRANAWNNRQVDLVNYFINNPASAVIQLMSGRKAQLVSLEKRVRDALIEKWGFLNFTIPANDYPNQPADVHTIGLPFVVFASTRLDADIVYDLTKAVAENRDRMVQAHAAFKGWQPENMPKGLGIQIHEGAIRYYKERGWLN